MTEFTPTVEVAGAQRLKDCPFGITMPLTEPSHANLHLKRENARADDSHSVGKPETPIKLGFMEGYSRWAKTYDSTWNTLIATEELHSLKLLDHLEGETALDVGTGTGRFALKLARRGWKVTALDPNPEMLAIAERSVTNEGLAVELTCASISDGLPVCLHSFDLVVCALTLTHVTDLQHAVTELSGAVKPGGHLLITDVHPDFVAVGMPTQFVEDGVTYHLPNENHSRGDYLRAIELSGLEVTAVHNVPGREVPGGFQTEFMRRNFENVNFALIVLAQNRLG